MYTHPLRRPRGRLLTLALLAAPMLAPAATLSLQPGIATVAPGQLVSLTLAIAGVANGPLATFDITIAFDAAALGFSGYTLSGALGSQVTGDAVDYSVVGTNTVQLTALSFQDSAALQAQQGAAFELATLRYMAPATATSYTTPVGFGTVWALGNAAGNAMTVTSQTGALISVVPEPAAAALFMAGLAAIGTVCRRSGPRAGAPQTSSG